MHFFNSAFIAASAFVTFVAAQGSTIAITSAPIGAQAGNTYKITWTGGDPGTPVTLVLKDGPSGNLNTVSTITTSASGGSFEWHVPTSLAPMTDYAIEISQGAENNFWKVGSIAGGTGTISISSATSSASSSSTSSASSSTITSSSTLTTTVSSSRNHTVTKHTLTSSSSSSTVSSASTTSASSAATTAASAPAPSGGASGLKSNVALVLGAVAAMAYLG